MSGAIDVIIIGAGASGLMCALTAGERGRKVLVLDHSDKIGAKILMSGGRRCNFTNLFIEPEYYLSANPHFCKSALKRFTQWDFITMVESHGIQYHEREHGQLFCDDSARNILDMLLAECDQAGVTIQNRCTISTITKPEDASPFHLTTNRGHFEAQSLVIATGGLSIPTMGYHGFGHEIALQFGMQIVPLKAGLVPFMFSDRYKAVFERLSGLALEATLTTEQQSFTENILFTHRGLSGPAVLQLSNYWQPGDSIKVNLLPNINLEQRLLTAKQEHPKRQLNNQLTQQLAKNLVQELERIFWPTWANKPMAEIPDAILSEIAENLQNWRLKPSATEGYRTAEVTIGGVDTEQLSSKTMQSTTQQGLYFIGEVVDIAGYLGGFNFQWAWSSGYAAGQYV
ncbi:MAG: NAD(P)/FAD-dependent oxidoreductase [Candidatus Polarisedimenticolaceae bacterium]|nr:NAD(P)/FAD-dependent oxidoreductase [Candidatus Polarisedimenticolaceae bacterium]